ncbi:MAG TPA: universal stress protein [Dehalococcoidia bacterium]|nr:universal stress protein [Dehalococcoidia bacterium]
MKILATFDGSAFSEAILPLLALIAGLPAAEFTLLSVAHEPHGQLAHLSGVHPDATGEVLGSQPVVVEIPGAQWAETKGQAIERRQSSREDYLAALVARLPAGVKVELAAAVSDNAAEAIVHAAQERAVDVIVMATHSRGPLVRALFGSVTEQVVRSGVAPVLVVHPKDG